MRNRSKIRFTRTQHREWTGMHEINVKMHCAYTMCLSDAKSLTVRVDTTAAGRYVGGECEIWNPKIFNVNIAECIDDGLIEALAREHGCDGIR